jgi:hypothetical protein
MNDVMQEDNDLRDHGNTMRSDCVELCRKIERDRDVSIFFARHHGYSNSNIRHRAQRMTFTRIDHDTILLNERTIDGLMDGTYLASLVDTAWYGRSLLL